MRAGRTGAVCRNYLGVRCKSCASRWYCISWMVARQGPTMALLRVYLLQEALGFLQLPDRVVEPLGGFGVAEGLGVGVQPLGGIGRGIEALGGIGPEAGVELRHLHGLL